MFEENPEFEIINESEQSLRPIEFLYDIAKECGLLIKDDLNTWHISEE